MTLLLTVLQAVGLDTSIETLFYWLLGYGLIFHVLLPFLGELVRGLIKLIFWKCVRWIREHFEEHQHAV
jgi:hypothetical protein